MSGHSKWSQIKHKKAVSDQQKGRMFSKLSRAITVAARGNPDQKSNARLRTAVETARRANMPSENIDRAVAKVSDATSSQLQELRLEILAPGNIALLVAMITDNRNRTMSELRNIASSHKSRLMEPGSLVWMFRQAPPPAFSESDVAHVRVLVDALNGHEDVQGVRINIVLPS